MVRKCQFNGCRKQPFYNVPGKTRNCFCSQHKHPSMVNVISQKCEVTDCSITPTYNLDGNKKARFCFEHKDPNMVDVKHKKCEYIGCPKIKPAFNLTGSKKGRFCYDHKLPNMVNIIDKRCEVVDCQKRPSYNVMGQSRRFCFDHKLPDMINVTIKTCESTDCPKIACYNISGESRSRFCVDHKHPGMIQIKYKKCQFENCTKQPTFNIQGESRPIFCTDHKQTDMINVIQNTCQTTGCRKQSAYNFKGQQRPIFCFDHKLVDMVDVKNKKKCESLDCGKAPCYGIPGHRATNCAEHKKSGMIVSPKKLCMELNCKEVAIYGIQKAVHCTFHFQKGEISLIGKECSNCHLVDVVDENGKCSTCDPNTIRRVQLAKQREVKLWLDHRGHNDYQYYDRIVDSSCGKERPDFAFDCGTHFVIVEVDEHQHRERQEECECVRMVNLSQTIGMPTVFIRYNPDPFKINGKTHNEPLHKRRETLLSWVQHIKKEIPISYLSFFRLYFDNYDKTKIQPIEIIPMHV